MLRWFYVAMHLFLEASAARRDARIRFLKAEVEILPPQTCCRWAEAPPTGQKPKRVRRPKIVRNLRELAVRLAKDNVGRGYRRTVCELRKLWLRIGCSSAGRILKDEGLTNAFTSA
jgi:hypothetical protein